MSPYQAEGWAPPPSILQHNFVFEFTALPHALPPYRLAPTLVLGSPPPPAAPPHASYFSSAFTLPRGPCPALPGPAARSAGVPSYHGRPRGNDGTAILSSGVCSAVARLVLLRAERPRGVQAAHLVPSGPRRGSKDRAGAVNMQGSLVVLPCMRLHTHTHRPLSLLYRLLSLCPSHTVSPPHLTLQIHQAEAVRARVCVIERCISADGPNHSSVQENATQLNPRLSLILSL